MELPAGYYIDHFWEAVRTVERLYGPILSEREHACLHTLRALSAPALALYVRLHNRKGPLFRLDKLRYPEIPDIHGTVAELTHAGLMERLPYADAATLPSALALFTHEELLFHLASHDIPRFPRKPLLLDWLQQWEQRAEWVQQLLEKHAIIHLSPSDPWPFFRFLFFGQQQPNLSDFVLRDMQLSITEPVKASSLTPRFATRADAEQCFILAQHLHTCRAHTVDALSLANWWQSLGIARETLCDDAARLHDRLAARIARQLEREGQTEAALALYASAPTPAARERRVRLLSKTGRKEEARALCESILAAPMHAEEAFIAAQLLGRLSGQRRSTTREALQQSQTLTLNPSSITVEESVLAHYRARGWSGVHGENWLWNALFGLFFWDIIFDSAYGHFHHPLQSSPADLFRPEFYPPRERAIEARLQELHRTESALARIRETFAQKQGIQNPLVGWHASVPILLEEMLLRIPPSGLIAVLRHMAQDLRRRRRGFPDLFLFRQAEYLFLEVKSPTDQLAPHQYQWLAFFAAAQIEQAILRVQWAENPAILIE